MFTDSMLTCCEKTVSSECTELNAELAGFNGEVNHVHPLVAYLLTLALSGLAQRLKGRLACSVQREYAGRCVRARMRGHLWSPSYFAVSCGGAPLSIVKLYIHRQERPL